MTSLHTKASSGRVVSIFSPKQLEKVSHFIVLRPANGESHKRATLTIRLSMGKLFNRLPCVLSPKVRKPADAMARQATIEIEVE